MTMSKIKAIITKLEILYLQEKIEALEDEFKRNVSSYDLENPLEVSVSLNGLKKACKDITINKANHVGHQLCYKGLDVSLFTDGYEDRIDRKIFSSILDYEKRGY